MTAGPLNDNIHQLGFSPHVHLDPFYQLPYDHLPVGIGRRGCIPKSRNICGERTDRFALFDTERSGLLRNETTMLLF
jgi:hypothetical protein